MPKNPSCYSLNDLARQLGVSAMTVSRVINNSGPVSAETRERVEEAMRTSGFKKDRFASINARKRGSRSRQYSVVVDAVVEADDEIDTVDFYSRIVLNAIRRLEGAGCHIVLTDLTRQPDMRSDAVAEADAILFCSPVSERVRQRIASLNPSIIRVAAFQCLAGASLVGPDDAGGGTMVAELAARGGHGRVAVLTAAHDSYAARTAAFLGRLQVLSPSAQVDVLDYPLQADGIHSDEAGILGLLERYWAAGPHPSLFFATGGFGTLMLHRFLRGHRIDVPGQVSLIGFDALPFYDHLDIPISRVEFSVGEVGTRLAEEALRRLAADGDGEEAKILLPCRYVEGRSFIDVSAMDPTRRSTHAL